LIGGYLSRVSERRRLSMVEQYPIIAGLLAMSEGEPLAAEEAAAFVAQGPKFVTDARVGYVLIDRDRVGPQFEALSLAAFDLEPIASDGSITLYRPRKLR
jgi:hypothetical protein